MSISFRKRTIWSLTATIALTVCLPLASAKTEAIKGKRYRLTAKHGPWMVMVAAIRDVPEERRIDGGLSAWEAADQLVYELRKKGIPAYTFLQNMQVDELRTRSKSDDARKYISQHEAVAVMAGNFKSPEDEWAKKILYFIKNDFEPSFLKNEKNGGLFARTPGRPSALSKALLTTNPLLKGNKSSLKKISPLIATLNRDMDHSLLKNKGKYTLRVATFRGNSIMQVGNKTPRKAKGMLSSMIGNNLDESGTKAWELTESLRSARKHGYDRNYEAYVFHDRFESYVTIGSFESLDDPRMIQLAKQFRGKPRQHKGKDVITAEVFTIPRNVPQGKQASRLWMFDVMPKAIEVPKYRR